MTAAQQAMWTQCTGRSTPPTRPAREAWCIVGRRGGKSRVASIASVFLACFRDYRQVLAPGEQGTLPIVAADRRQARTVLRYVVGLLEGCPMLARMIVRKTGDTIELTNGVTIEIHTASFRALRGYTVIGAVCDEVAFWRSEDAANPDVEIVNALRPAMATVPGALLLGISSPYARRGVLWDMYRRHYGQGGDILVWQAATRTMNPSVPEHLVARALEEDASAARAEWLGEFRRDLEAFVSRDVLEACTVPGRHEVLPASGVSYAAFCDPSGGSADSFTLAVAHAEGERVVLDAVREVRPPFSPDAVVAEYASVLKTYGISTVTADRYAGHWVVETFAKHGIQCEQSAAPKSELYANLLPLLNGHRVDLLDVPRLAAQLGSLERRTSHGGRDTIDHAPGGHDDLANAVAGALVAAGQLQAGVGEIFASNLAAEPYQPVHWDAVWRERLL